MSFLSRLVAAFAALVLTHAALAQSNNAPPQIVSQPPLFGTLKLGYRYEVRASDADGDALRFVLVEAPTGAAINAESGLLQWRPDVSQLGQHTFRVRVQDTNGNGTEQVLTPIIAADFCAIYPIAVPKQRLDGLNAGARIEQLPRGNGTGQFSWLTWNGGVDAPTLAASLVPPGDSYRYVHPDNRRDTLLEPGDWSQGASGSMNANSVRDRLDALKTQDIIVPVWDSVRGQGSRFDYRVASFATVRLHDFQLTGQGWLTFEYKGPAHCYNQAPVATPATLSTAEDTPLALTLSASDADRDTLSFTIVTAPAHGRLSGTAPELTYTPAADFNGSDRFSFKANDGRLDSAVVEVAITVVPVNDAPIARPQSLTTAEDVALPITVTGSDIDGDTLSFTIANPPARGTLSGTAPNLTYTPNANFNGRDEFTFKVGDGRQDSSTSRIEIAVTPVNDAPVAQAQTVSVNAGATVAFTLAGSDIDGDALAFRLVDSPAHGRLTGTAPSLVFTPESGYQGSDGFSFVANDGAVDSVPVRLAIDVVRGNRHPQIVSVPAASVDAGAVFRYGVSATDPDAGDVLAYSVDGGPNGHTIDRQSGALVWSPAADLPAQGMRGKNLSCRLATPAPTRDLLPQLKWHWKTENTLSIPMVVPLFDSNGDGRVDATDKRQIVFLSHSGFVDSAPGTLRVLDAQTGTTLRTVSDSALLGRASSHLAVGDLDGDGRPEIVYYGRSGGTIAVDNDLRLKWQSPNPPQNGAYEYGAPTLADLDGDGKAEVIARNYVLNSDGSLRFAETSIGYFHASVSIAVDLDLDGKQEVLIGNRAYSHDGRLLWEATGVPAGVWGHAVGNFNSDPYPEIVVSDPSAISQLDHTGQVLWRTSVSARNGGPLAVGDLDGDGRAEIVVERGHALVALRGDGTPLWRVSVTDASDVTGATLFDFDGDGAIEVVYADQAQLRIHNGSDGALLWSIANGSATASEYPVVADIDQNGHADLLLVSDTGTSAGLRAFSNPAWMPTRSIWNQFAYGIDNINDSAGIPRQPARGWLTHNSFRRNSFVDHEALGLADLALFDLRLDAPNGTAIKVLVVNRGLAATPASTTVRIYNGNPAAGGTLLGTMSVPKLAMGEEQTLTLSGLTPGSISKNLYARINEDGAIQECLSNNDSTSAAFFQVRATDPGGLFDTQRFTVTVNPVNQAPTLHTTELPSAAVGLPYRFALRASDPNIGDGLLFSLVNPPAGLSIEAVSGELRWTPTTAQAGSATITVKVTDLGDLAATRTFALSVASNRNPTFTSAPVTTATANAAYRYVAQATDPDGDRLNYALTSGPLGMTIDGQTGAVTWTPSTTGSFTVAIQAQDGRGGTAVQQYTLTVARANRAPTIGSTATTAAVVGSAYSYTVTATDPDGDPLTYRLTTAPTGMSISAGGVVSFTPSAGQVGSHSVRIEVSDGRGGTATQAFTLSVTATNAAPSITSTPYPYAKVGKPYRYAPTATDPEGDALTWSLASPPAGMTIDGSSGLVSFTPATAGTLPVAVRVSDGRNETTQNYTLTVQSADVALAGSVTITPNPVQPGASLTVEVTVSGAASAPTLSATLDGAPVTLALGTTTLTAPSATGTHTLAVQIRDSSDTVQISRSFSVGSTADTTPPAVSLSNPAAHPSHDAVEITAPTPITGSVQGDDVARWSLGLQPAGSGSRRILAQGNSAFAAREITVFDPTLLLNGQYILVLEAEDAAGNRAQVSRTLRVTGDMKLGHFSITVEDVSVPVAGIPVTVTRTYDTRRAHESLDFGFGWTVDVHNVQVQESRRAGYGWDLQTSGSGAFAQRCIRPTGDPIVTVRMPDGAVESFRARAEPECRSVFDGDNHVQLVFEPLAGTRTKLQQTDFSILRWGNVSGYPVPILFDELRGDATPADPRHYRLTTAEGQVYDIDQVDGLSRVYDPATETSLTFSRDGVRHSSGVGITFVRNVQGWIERMVLPDASDLEYRYTPSGDLDFVLDPLEQKTDFEYYSDPRWPHYLKDILDARGIRVSRNEYDDNGRLVATIDADGKRIEYSHDLAARTSIIKDRRGKRFQYVYDAQGRVLSETNLELGETIRRTYNEVGDQLTETNGANETTTWTYDPRGNRETETNHALETTSWTYNAKNQLLTQKDHSQRTLITNVFDERSGLLLLSTTDALNQATTFGYVGGSGPLERITAADQATTTFAYDPATGFKIRETDALQQATTYVNDAQGRVRRETRQRTLPNGTSETLVTRYEHDAKGRLTKVIHPDESFTTTTYNAIDLPIEQCDELRRCTTTTYDARGLIERIDYPDVSYETQRHDENGNRIEQRDRSGRVTKYVFDAANRLTETIHPDATPATDSDNPRSISVYDKAGRLLESIDENQRRTLYRYDAAGRRTQVIQVDPATGTAGAGPITQTGYDNTGRRNAMTDANNRTTKFVLDDAGRVIETIHPDDTPATDSDNPRTRTEYDAVGRKTADIDEQGRTTRYAYDKLGRLIAVVLPNPQTGANPPLVNGQSPDSGTLTTRYRYDEVGNKIEQIDAEGRSTRWEYDKRGRETARVLPEGQRETKRYNAAGELIEQVDFNGKATTYQYDAGGRLERIVYPTDPAVGFRYLASGERTAATDSRGTSTTQYDSRGRVLQSKDADGGIIEYQFDPAGNLIARISPSQSLLYTYDALNRIKTVTRTVDGEAPSVTRYQYDAAGNRTAMSGGDGTQTEYRYDARNRLKQLIKKTAAGALLVAMSYTVDASGLRTAVEESDASGLTRTVAYQYDPVKRLTRESIDHREAGRDRVSSWTYDKVGNRLSQTVTIGQGNAETTSYQYDRNDRLTTETSGRGTTRYTYDANGNTKSKSGPDGDVTYTYNDANRLVEARSADGVTTYVYNADGLRVRQTHTPSSGQATTTWYLQDSAYPYAQVVEEHVGDSVASKRLSATYTFADDLVSQTRYGSTGTPTTRFIQADGFGSTRWLTDGSGAITDSIDYDAFGVEIGRSGTTEVEHLYRGERWDANVAAYDLRARLYTPGNGRFLTQDSFRGFSMDPQSLHKYVYTHSNPVNGIDPSGHFNMVELGTSLTVAGIVNAGIGVAMNAFDPTVQNVWGDVGSDFAFGAITAPVGGLMGRVLGPVLRGVSAPVIRAVGRMNALKLVGRPAWQKALVRMSRFLVTTNKGYPSVTSTLAGRTLKLLFPKVQWEMHHIFIQQSWFRATSSSRLYADVTMNQGLQRIGNAGWNLMPIPRSLNAWLGRSQDVATPVFATLIYSAVVFGPWQMAEMIDHVADGANDAN